MMRLIVQSMTQAAHSFAWITQQEALENNRLRKFIDRGKEFGRDYFEKDRTLQIVENAIADIT